MGKGGFDEIGSTRASLLWYYSVVIGAQAVGVVALVLIGVLAGQYRGGFGWGSNVDQLLNNHIVLMTLGMVFFYGDAIVVYRVFRDVNKLTVKILHATLLAMSFTLSATGLVSVFASHSRAKPPQGHLSSLHSWVGFTTVTLFALQWLCGFVTFLFPKLNEQIRTKYMPSHKLWGKVIFLFAVTAVMMGATEYGIFNNLFDDATLRTQRNIINVFGFAVLIFAVLILYLVGNPGFQRPGDKKPTEEVPLVAR